jgi:hypothetical protein
MKTKTKILNRFLQLETAALAFLAVATLASTPTLAGDYQQNGSFLARRFLTDSKNAPALTDDFLSKTDKFYKTPLLFPNGGLLTSSGMLDHPPSAAVLFLDHVAAYESANEAVFTLMPYLNGYSPQDASHPANQRLDLDNPSVRANIVAECGRYVSAKVPGSYVQGSRRAFDGIILDIEPAGDPSFLHSLKTLLTEIRASFDGMSLKNKKIGFAAPQHTDKVPKPNWGWNSSDYHYMARYVDYVVAMTYDSGLEKAEYQSWIENQTAQILQAVSGAAWNFNDEHPRPTNGVKVLIGLPGFWTRTKAHDPDVENVAHGAPGVLAGLSHLHSTDRTSLGYFQGTAMFSHDGGAADSLYARYGKDWLWWLNHWLGK